jgi:hypothetical protein
MRVQDDNQKRRGYWTKSGLGQQRSTRPTVAWPFRPDDCNSAYVTNQQKAEILVSGVSWGQRAQISGPTYILLPRRLLIPLKSANSLAPSLLKKGAVFNDLHKTEGETVWSLLLPLVLGSNELLPTCQISRR